MQHEPTRPGEFDQAPSRLLPPMLFQNEYVWFVFLASMDILLTWAILGAEGNEVNPIAEIVIMQWGLPGAILFKFGLTLFVIIVCEYVGRRRFRTALTLARAAIVVSAVPVVYSLALLSWHIFVRI